MNAHKSASEETLNEVINGLKKSLEANDTTAVAAFVGKIGAKLLLSNQLITQARLFRQATVIKFLATLIAQNCPERQGISTLLNAYMSISQLQLNEGIAALPEGHVIKDVVLNIIKSQPSLPSPTTKRKIRIGNNEDWLLAIELCLEHDKDYSATQLVKEFPLNTQTLPTWKRIANSALSRLSVEKSYVSGIWLAHAEFCESIYQKFKPCNDDILLGELAILISQMYFKASKYEQSIDWSGRTRKRLPQVQRYFHIAKCQCHMGDLRSSAATLDNALLQMCKSNFCWDVNAPSAWGSAKQKKPFSTKHASEALTDLQRILGQKGWKAFLVSGTLLGYARNGSLLSHDKDVDVGVMGWESQFDVAATLLQSKLFRVPLKYLKGKSCYFLPIIHRNTDVNIDIFFYRSQGDKLVTGVNHSFGYLQEFSFSKFDLQKIKFLGTDFYVPENIELNLRENFGNWRIPDKNYISHLESPSTIDVGGQVYMIVARITLLAAMISKDRIKAHRAFNLATTKARPGNALNPDLVARLFKVCQFSNENRESEDLPEEAYSE